MGHELHPIMEKALAPFLNMTDKEDKLDRTEEIKVIFDKCLENSVVWRHIEFAPDFPYDVKITELLYELANVTNKYIGHIESLQPSEPHLGCATTKELLDEIRARVEVDGKLNYRTSSVSGIKVHNDIQFLLDCEADCIKSGNSLSPKEQKVALDVIANIQQGCTDMKIKCEICGEEINKYHDESIKNHFCERKIKLAFFHKPEGGNPLDPDSNICETRGE